MGATKYLFEAQAGKDQVVVLRSEKYVNGKLTDSIDAISNERDEKVSFPVVVYDRSFFNQFTGSLQPGYIFQLPTDRWEVNARIRSKGGDPGKY